MELQTFQYVMGKGWSVKNFPALDSDQTLILIFAAPEFINSPEPIKEIAKFYPQSKIIGCSSSGEILGPNIYDRSLSVAVMRFKNTAIQVVKTKIDSADRSFEVGQKIAKQLNQENLRSIFVLSDGLQVNGSNLVKGLNSLEKDEIVITGGLAGDGDRFQKTWSIFGDEILTDHVVAAGFYGDNIQIGHASRGGWDIFGPERRITKAKDNILYELDDQPALALYKEYLGDRAAGLPATGLLYPLSIRKNMEDQAQLVRTILGIDEKNQSLTFAGDMPVGYLAKLMRANFDRLITSANEAGLVAIEKVLKNRSSSENSILAVAISCVGRRLLLGERIEEETESLLDALPKGTQQIGFYSYGELSPYASGKCDLHNQTMTLTTFYEQ